MPDFAPEIYRKAAEVRMRQYESEYSLGPLTWKDFAPEVTEILDAVAADLGQHVAERILAHMEAHGPATEGAEWTRRYRRYFGTAARVAAFAFLTGDDLKRMAATALAAAPEDSDG